MSRPNTSPLANLYPPTNTSLKPADSQGTKSEKASNMPVWSGGGDCNGNIVPGLVPQLAATPLEFQALLDAQSPDDLYRLVSSPAPEITMSPPVKLSESNLQRIAHRVKSQMDAFKGHYEKREWEDASRILKTLGESLASGAETLDANGQPRWGSKSSLSAEAAAARDAMLDLDPVMRAFAMGCCHHFDQVGRLGWAWMRAMRFQPADTEISMQEIVRHYAKDFDVDQSAVRREAIRATLVHLSWLAPCWPYEGPTSIPHGTMLADALRLFSLRLGDSYRRLAGRDAVAANDQLPNERQHAFLQDVLTALDSRYCSPLLASELSKYPAFQGNRDRNDALAKIKAGDGGRLFPVRSIRVSQQRRKVLRVDLAKSAQRARSLAQIPERMAEGDPVAVVSADQRSLSAFRIGPVFNPWAQPAVVTPNAAGLKRTAETSEPEDGQRETDRSRQRRRQLEDTFDVHQPAPVAATPTDETPLPKAADEEWQGLGDELPSDWVDPDNWTNQFFSDDS